MIAAYRPTATLSIAGESLTVAVRQVTNPTRIALIKNQAGLDDADAILEARLVEPKSLPASVKAGMKGEYTWSGRKGIVTLQPYETGLRSEWTAIHGERIYLAWDSDEV